MRTALASLAIVCVAMQSGCAKLKEGFQSFGGSSPRHLDSSPDTVGLLIVHAPMRHKGSLSFGIGSSISLDGALLVRADTDVAIQENSVKDLVLFQLRPATYHMVAVRGSFRSGNFEHHLVAPLDSLVGPIDIVAGQITYVGRLTVTGHSAIGRGGVHVHVRMGSRPLSRSGGVVHRRGPVQEVSVDSNASAATGGAASAAMKLTVLVLFVLKASLLPAPASAQDSLQLTSLVAGWAHTCGLTKDGRAYCWGWGAAGGLGIGDTVVSTTPVAVTGGPVMAGGGV